MRNRPPAGATNRATGSLNGNLWEKARADDAKLIDRREAARSDYGLARGNYDSPCMAGVAAG